MGGGQPATHRFVLLVPAGLTFLATADWSRPRPVLLRLAVPALALTNAFAMLCDMERIRADPEDDGPHVLGTPFGACACV